MADSTQTSVPSRSTARRVLYGRYRSEGKNARAYLFATSDGRSFLRTLWTIKLGERLGRWLGR